MEIIDKDNYKKAAQIIKNGGVIAFPTETVYGLGIIFNNKSSYDRLIKIKQRPPEKPFSLMLDDVSKIQKYGEVNEITQKLIDAFMPGEITIIIKAKSILPHWCISNENMVGIRVPNLSFVQNMIREIDSPILVPSANKSNEKEANNHQEVLSIFENEIDGVVVGESISKVPSSIVIVDEDVKIIREGNIKKEDILKVINK